MSLLRVQQRLKGQILAMAFGGEGILRQESVVVFVPFTSPGDEVEVEVTETKKSFARAKLVTILKPSAHRITARCPHFGECGGCQLQHIDYNKQISLKHGFVNDALVRIGKLKDVVVKPAIRAQAQWNYRRSVKLRFTFRDEKLVLGYVNASSDGVMPVQTCPIFSEDRSFWTDLNVYLAHCFVGTKISSGFLSLFRASDADFVGLLEVETDVAKKQLALFQSLPVQLKGLLISTPSGQHTVADVSLGYSQDGSDFVYTPLSFVQNHPEQSAKLNQQVLDIVSATRAKTVFDLYCGFGVTSIGLAQRGLSVTAVEGNPESIRLAHINASANAVKVDWICDDVAHFIEPRLKREIPDVVIVNPPRTGLSPKVTHALARHQAQHIVYVSCMPQTLARDLAILQAAGYRIDECQPYDMFPQTTHVETVMLLSRSRAK